MKPKLIFSIAFLIASCTSKQLDNNMPVPTVGIEGTQTSSAPLISTPQPTTTKSPVDEIFVIPTQQDYFPSTPTPIATPEFGASNMVLRDLSADDFVDLMDEMELYSYQNFPPFGDWWSDGQFVSSQQATAVLLQEYLYRYPNSAYSERLSWQIVFIDFVNFEGYWFDGIGGNLYDDQWLLSELETNLNEGEISPNDLEIVLDRYWLDVDYFQPVKDLFGDGKTAWFYVIVPQVWQHEETNIKSPDYFGRGGLFVVVRELSNGEFQLFLLDNALSFSHGASSLFDISDHNKNGIPEIAISVGYHSGSLCSGNLSIYEWRTSYFDELTDGKITIGSCPEYYEYFLSNNIPAIRLTNFFPNLKSVFLWRGDQYEFSGYEYSNLVEKWQTISYDPNASFIDEIVVIENILSSENREGLSLAQIDFLRFRLGLAYALDSNPPQAQDTLKELLSNPADPSKTVYSKLAKNFLNFYSGDKDLYFACQKSQEMLDEIWNPLGYQREIEEFGFSGDPSSPFAIGTLRCYYADVLELLINKVPLSPDVVPDELRRNGVNVYYAEQQDINLDGVSDEWLVIFDDGVYLAFLHDRRYQSLAIERFWGWEPFSEIQVRFENIEGLQATALILSNDFQTSVYAIGKDYTLTNLNSFFASEDIYFVLDENPAQIQVFNEKPTSDKGYFEPPWKGYRWDATHKKFSSDLLEYLIFIERSPRKVAAIADKVLPLFLDWANSDYYTLEFPRYLYLFGLSYELVGEPQKAAETYWHLWREFPNSQYALMARYKLNPANP